MPAAPNAHAEKVNKIATERRYSCEELLAQRGGVLGPLAGVGLGGGSFTALSWLRALSLSLSCTGCALSRCCVGVCERPFGQQAGVEAHLAAVAAAAAVTTKTEKLKNPNQSTENAYVVQK